MLEPRPQLGVQRHTLEYAIEVCPFVQILACAAGGGPGAGFSSRRSTRRRLTSRLSPCPIGQDPTTLLASSTVESRTGQGSRAFSSSSRTAEGASDVVFRFIFHPVESSRTPAHGVRRLVAMALCRPRISSRTVTRRRRKKS